MRLIDDDALVEDLIFPTKAFEKGFKETINDAPTIDAVPVKHGQWLDGNRGRLDGTLYWYRYCSECLYERDDGNEDKDTPYCPNCGAKMDGGDIYEK